MCAGVWVNMININKLRNWFSSILFLPTGMKYSTRTYVQHRKLLVTVLSLLDKIDPSFLVLSFTAYLSLPPLILSTDVGFYLAITVLLCIIDCI